MTIDQEDIDAFTAAVLQWWRANATKFLAWPKAARIVFALSPNSASCERVFALVRNMFGDEQMRSLADILFASFGSALARYVTTSANLAKTK